MSQTSWWGGAAESGSDGSGTDAPESPEGAQGGRPRRGGGPRSDGARRRRRRSLASLLVMLGILGGLGFLGARVVPPLFIDPEPVETALTDHPGPGQGSVTVVVAEGATGTQIGQVLQQAGVVATVDAFTTAFAANAQATGIQPGTYELLLEMRASDAVTALLDPNRRIDVSVTIAPTKRSDEVYQRIADAFGVPVADVEAAAHDYAALGLEGPPNADPEALDPMEGWWLPGTYSATPDQGPAEVLRQAYAATIAELDAFGVAPEDRLRVLTVASIALREVSAVDYGKVARVIANRLDPENLASFPTLGMDSTYRYYVDRTQPGVELDANAHNTDASPYNTRLNPGLPPSPISAVSSDAIAAAVAPDEGPWLFFVTVDLCSGETHFATTTDEFTALSDQFKAWNAEWVAGGSVC